jgi:2-iminoacetate synthase
VGPGPGETPGPAAGIPGGYDRRMTPSDADTGATARTLGGSFAEELDRLPLGQILEAAGLRAPGMGEEVLESAGNGSPVPLDLDTVAALLDPRNPVPTEALLRAARGAADRVFGRSVLMYAPCYLSSWCVNQCAYCGFNFSMKIPRVLLSPAQAADEIRLLAGRGIRRVLLVAGEYPSKITPGYVAEVIEGARGVVPEVDLELAPATTEVYAAWVSAGAGGVTCYQETYNPFRYEELHPRGPKMRYTQRLGVLERAGEAGVRRLGLGALMGLADPRRVVLALIAHARFLQDRFPQALVTVSLPRLRDAVPGFRPHATVDDDELVRFHALVRLALPRAGLVVSTREAPAMRLRLLEAGVTQMSAGSVTVPGGYASGESEGPQFDIADHRSVSEVVADLERLGFDVRWVQEAR